MNADDDGWIPADFVEVQRPTWDWYQEIKPHLGKADWRWDDELQLHLPCCSQPYSLGRCGNGPLVGDAILSGDCGESHLDVAEREAGWTDGR